jgi:anti-sigma factor RsiW
MRSDSQKECLFGNEIVSYMYDEMPVAERPKFEEHLTKCQACTDEFAAVSFARFETYDWKRNEFDALATPQIVIPYKEKAVPFGQRLYAWLGWASAVPVAAALILAFGYFFLVDRNSNDQPAVAKAVQGPPSIDAGTVTAPPDVEVPTIAVTTRNGGISQPVVRQAALKRKPALPKTFVARSIVPGINVRDDVAINIPSQSRPAPRLGLNDEDEDRSLRLADLFEQSGPPPQR